MTADFGNKWTIFYSALDIFPRVLKNAHHEMQYHVGWSWSWYALASVKKRFLINESARNNWSNRLYQRLDCSKNKIGGGSLKRVMDLVLQAK